MTTIFKINQARIFEARNKLVSHPLLRMNNLQTVDDLRKFMEHHVYCVWDFMSLLKHLQDLVCPSGTVWFPNRAFPPETVRLVNEIVLCEESDLTPVEGKYMSHFDLYLSAMREVGADIRTPLHFIDQYHHHLQWEIDNGRDVTIETWEDFLRRNHEVPAAALDFVGSTMEWVLDDKPHCVAAAFCYGREDVIPDMFKCLLQQLEINEQKAPYFHFYLDRHIKVDAEEHGPAAHQLLETLCGNDPHKIVEAEEAAIAAIEARIKFWDAVAEAL